MSAGTLPYPADLDRQPADGQHQLGRARTSGKWPATLLSVLLLAAVIFPVVQNWVEAPQDDFPLSYYPMFSFEKGDRQRVTYLIVYDSAGDRFRVPYQYAGQGGLNQVRRQMNKQLERGQALRLCRNVATRVSRSDELPEDLGRVQIVTGTFLMSEFFAGNRVPVSETVRAECPVLRG